MGRRDNRNQRQSQTRGSDERAEELDERVVDISRVATVAPRSKRAIPALNQALSAFSPAFC